ncbi:phosphatase PAP2 family protein [Candidatus Woesearchaeota archaeon]|jgi:membrane-associated phospholipid phosphatase|nr:phosphatase PAP2 family protein [Candidatus Woesearchaeota archaeon]MBT4387209.1 phosphatase PAP2 family protein [Candidatus Woesearchaeota archaeon]MBT4596211.1 phosphatase PAP2 family protein [Candidatus Woesearchaeota archaeon]MBT5741566.1 phosphatase PAP2 family protein [Candidatus Woesearchaeota archaeon]MBT6505473.1 phosphatase PAP2 family protein [Candidatus Woesearchaeota archaeon]
MKFKEILIYLLNKFEVFGDIPFFFLILVYSYFFNIKYSNVLFLSFIFSLSLIITFRLLVKKKRPNNNYNKINPFYLIDKNSFPSGHSTLATLLFLYSLSIVNSIFLIYFNLLVLLLVFLSRKLLKKHTLIDIISGILIAYLFWNISLILIL